MAKKKVSSFIWRGLIVVGLLMSVVPMVFAADSNLALLEDKKRVLILTKGEDCRQFQKQVSLFKSTKSDVLDRDIVVFQYDGNLKKWGSKTKVDLKPKDLEQVSDLSSFSLVLIGKDGGVKFRSKNKLVESEKIYALIDSMPMRQEEMRRKRNSK